MQDAGHEKRMSDREKAKAERRDLIVNAAIECFIRNGIHQTGIREIAEQAKVSLGNLYNHFSGKGELIAEIAVLDGEGLERFAMALDNSENPAVAVSEFVDEYLDYISQTENAVLTIDIMAEAIRNPTVAKHFEANCRKLTDALSATIKRGISTGDMREQINIDETVKLLLDAVEGLGLRSGLSQVKPSENARKALQEMIFRMLSSSPE
ncbi:MAG: TetR family transcriptional regulator [Hyphomicrobiales bacterium]|nr:MAG: TetR family transcriptional regulator [Hyphomicrobiales bacterium]